MYGMVNNAIRDHGRAVWGEPIWERMAEAAGVPSDGFSALQPYDDAKTVALLVAAAELTGRPLEAVLREIGRGWVAYADTTRFAPLLAMAGDDPAAMIENLDAMHTQIKASLPDLVMPRFSCIRGAEGVLEVVYESEREGLAPFVEGLFEGLATRFGQRVEVLDFAQVTAASARWTLRFLAADEQAHAAE